VIRLALVVALLIAGIYGAWPASPIRHAPGIVAPHDPAQVAVSGRPAFTYDGVLLQPLARFDVEARVLSTRRYTWFGSRYGLRREDLLSPIDLALGWGPMSDQQVIDRLDISQGARFYAYRWSGPAPPLPPPVLVEHSANMHLIPASSLVWRQLKAVRAGHVVRFSGYLVSARTNDGWKWDSSLTRKDSGAGACELVWVETVSVTR